MKLKFISDNFLSLGCSPRAHSKLSGRVEKRQRRADPGGRTSGPVRQMQRHTRRSRTFLHGPGTVVHGHRSAVLFGRRSKISNQVYLRSIRRSQVGPQSQHSNRLGMDLQ